MAAYRASLKFSAVVCLILLIFQPCECGNGDKGKRKASDNAAIQPPAKSTRSSAAAAAAAGAGAGAAAGAGPGNNGGASLEPAAPAPVPPAMQATLTQMHNMLGSLMGNVAGIGDRLAELERGAQEGLLTPAPPPPASTSGGAGPSHRQPDSVINIPRVRTGALLR